ncbi:hypothetical protein QVD17_04490 [Tagetes erecta]|uniref:Uncharacterized protein n=1 Tax=Tagetes erecta TaxID=13708 RepID=A0AAD8LA85_TARER|nr:hypothetical protein QVD17_04490 [Tagetes erecta]
MGSNQVDSEYAWHNEQVNLKQIEPVGASAAALLSSGGQMAKQGQTFFLEEWLKTSSGAINNTNVTQSTPQSARAIIQAWTDLRESLNQKSFSQQHYNSLQTLISSGNSLYVADPQVKLIISILSASYLSLPSESYPLFLRLLYTWVRKSSKPSVVLVTSSINVILQLFSSQSVTNKSALFFTEGILLLGAFTFVPSISEDIRTQCLDMFCKLLEEDYKLVSLFDDLVPSALAGMGYALSSCGRIHFIQILDLLFGIWNKEGGPSSSVVHGLMILHLVEWVLYNCIQSQSFEKITTFSRVILEASNARYAPFSVVMGAAGALRASNRSISSGLMELRSSAEKRIEIVAHDLISKSENEVRDRVLLQCISLALSRSGDVLSRDSLLLCIASAILTEIFPLRRFYSKILEVHVSFSNIRVHEVKEHLQSVVFKEAGVITGVFCKQYAQANEGCKIKVENLIWDFCHDVYASHRQVALMLHGKNEELIQDLEKITEPAFLMVVFFALAVTKQKLTPNIPREIQLDTSVKILISFSCLEYFRRMRLSEYMDTIRAVAGSVQEDHMACVSFVESIPSYGELTKVHVTSNKMEFTWSKDEMQTSRILFYLRVIPTCAECIPTSVFRKTVAPILFLYMGHPNGKVTRASHSTFVAFVSSGKDDDSERVLLKEQIVYYYMQRSLEGYPGVTPFEGMASGVAALVRYLPAGSPSIFYCVHCLVEKASSLCSEWTELNDDLEPCKKLLDLLLRLLSLVDIQVLPSLMKLLAQLVVQLPQDAQNMVLNDLYAQVSDSDDVTRKPALVSWVQSLSYLSSQATINSVPKRDPQVKNSGTKSWNKGRLLGLNRIFARI